MPDNDRPNIRLFLLALLVNLASAVDLHVGLIGPFSGPWKHRGVQMLEVADYAMNWFSTVKANQLRGTTWNIIIHHCDHANKGDWLEGIAAKYALGTATVAECQADWQYSSWTNQITGATGVEPVPHALDAILGAWGSGFIPRILQGLKTAGLRTPCYMSGTNGLGAWVNDDGTDKWDNAVNSGEVIADGEMRPCIVNLAQKNAKTIVFVEQANAGSWTSSLCDGARSQSKDDGIDIIADAVLDFKNCGYKHFPTGDALTTYNECVDHNVGLLEEAVGSVLYSGNKYSADALALCTYTDMCFWLPTYLKKNNINFGTIIGYRCHKSISEEEEEEYTTGIGQYAWDYWLHFQFLPGATGVYYDQRFNPDNIGIFAKYGEGSSAGLWHEMQKMRGLDTAVQGGYQESLMFNSWEMLLQDLVRVDGDPSKIIEGFNIHRPVMTSHWGPLSAVPGGYSSMHMPTVLQQFPKWKHEGKSIAVGPEAVAKALFVFPAPFWNKRSCEDSCVACPKCEELVGMQVPVLLGCFGPSVIFGVIAILIGQKSNVDMKLVVSYLVMAGAFIANLATDVLAILTILYQMEEEIIDRDAVIPYIYAVFTAIGLILGTSRVKIQMAGAYMATFETPTPMDIAYMAQLDSISVMLSLMLADLPTFIVQAITAIMFAPSEPLIVSMILTAMSMGYAGSAPEIIKDNRLFMEVAIEHADAKKHQLPPGTKDYIAPISKAVVKVLNPCDLKMGLSTGGGKHWSDLMGKKVDGEDKST